LSCHGRVAPVYSVVKQVGAYTPVRNPWGQISPLCSPANMYMQTLYW